MTNSVTITAGARLHFGLCSLAPLWAGVGAYVFDPATRLTVARGEPGGGIAVTTDDGVPPGAADRARAAVAAVRADADVRLTLHAAPPSHCGFGSGTQLMLAAATAAARLLGEFDPDPRELAAALGRAGRSRLGAAGFRSGGLLLDPFGAAAAAEGVGVRSVALPTDWRWVIVTPSETGAVAGPEEVAALAALPALPRPTENGLRRMIRESLPVAVGRAGPDTAPDAALFARVIGDYGARVGRHFAPVQGGVFASAAVRLWAADRRDRGLPPPVQSSWGPAACAVCADTGEADAEADEVRRLLGDAATVAVTATRNGGATIQER